MDFTIDRSKWRCGGGDDGDRARGTGATLLLNEEGYMCCLGQFCQQLGVDGLLRRATPDVLHRLDKRDLTPLVGILVNQENGRFYDNDLCQLAVEINDDHECNDAERETALTELLAKHGHTLRFVGEYGS